MSVAIVRQDFGDWSLLPGPSAREQLARTLASLESILGCPRVERLVLACPDDEANRRFVREHEQTFPRGTLFHFGHPTDMFRRLLEACDACDARVVLDIAPSRPWDPDDLSDLLDAVARGRADVAYYARTPKTLSPKAVRADLLRLVRREHGGWPYYGHLTLHEDRHATAYVEPRQRPCSNKPIHRFEGAVEHFLYFRRNFAGGVVLEVGTGFNPLLALLFRAAGASRVHTVDIVPLWDFDPALYFGQFRAYVENQAPRLEPPLRERLSEILTGLESPGPLLERLARAGVHYHLGSVEEPLPVPDASVDYVYSDVVFEHLRDVPAAVRGIAAATRPGGRGMHRIGLLDHRECIVETPFDFYLHPAREWDSRLTNSYTNRWLRRMYVEAFRSHGLDVEVTDAMTWPIPDELHARFDPSFRRFPKEELDTTYCTLLTVKPVGGEDA